MTNNSGMSTSKLDIQELVSRADYEELLDRKMEQLKKKNIDGSENVTVYGAHGLRMSERNYICMHCC